MTQLTIDDAIAAGRAGMQLAEDAMPVWWRDEG